MKPVLAGVEKYAVLYIGALVWLPNVVLPYDVMLSMQRFGLSEDHAGWLATGQLLVLALTTLGLSRVVSRLDKRRSCVLASLLAALATGGLLLCNGGLAVAVALKLVVGASMGVLVACSYSLASYYQRPEKIFAEVAITMALLYGAVMSLVPQVIARVGAHGGELVQLVLLAAGLLLAWRMPVARAPGALLPADAVRLPGGQATAAGLPTGAGWMLAGVFALFVSQTVSVGFAGPASAQRALSPEALGTVFTVASLAQLPAALFITWLNDRVGPYLPIVGGLLLLVGVALGMYVVGGRWTFCVATGLINAGATVANPYMVALLGGLDDSGRSTALAGSLTNIGSALGPALAGVTAASAGLAAVGWLASALLVCAIAGTLLARRRLQSTGRQPGVA